MYLTNMNNILNNDYYGIRIKLSNDSFSDFSLYGGNNVSCYENGLTTNCLTAYIDTTDPDCVWFNTLYSKNDYIWSDSINKDVKLYNIGFTGVDNGIIHFEKDKISNYQFYKLFTQSILTINNNDLRLILNKVTGNTQLYEYPSSIIVDDNITTLKLNGGFYQGFFKLFGYDYQTLPTYINGGWTLEFTLKRCDFEKESDKTLNDLHPENKGIFFYIGTRAENKWWILYDGTENDIIEKKCNIIYSNDFNKEYIKENGQNLNTDYLQDIKEHKDLYNSDDYVESDYIVDDNCCGNYNYFSEKYIDDEYFSNICNCNSYVKDDYVSNDMFIDENEDIKTNDGYSLSVPNIYEIKTDNKFILFNRTCTGFTTENWDENKNVILTGITRNNNYNYFTLFNRTCTGLTTDNITNEYVNNNSYNILNDITNNALAFIINDNGEIGYRYLINDCENKTLKIIEEYSDKDVISKDIWYTIDIKILTNHNLNEKCDNGYRGKMKILFYVNGKLKLISKELPELNLRELNDIKEKQESVPYNISLGGGTQGLCDMININYMKIPEYIFPLEKYFAGTFIGEIKTFKFYNCYLNYNQILNNVEFEKNLVEK